MDNTNKDLLQLIEKINKIADGDFTYAKEGDYDNPEAARAVNSMLNEIMGRNNHFLVRINDAMIRIADNSCIKAMLDEIDCQRVPIKVLKSVKNEFSESKEQSENSIAGALALSRQIRRTADEYALTFDKVSDELANLLTSAKLDVQTETKIEGLAEEVLSLKRGMITLSMRMRDMSKDVTDTYNSFSEQGEKYIDMLQAIDSITKSFEDLFSDCLAVGSHFQRISRDIDNARNDMFRQNSWPLLHDKLKVFTVDHLTLAWRLYNHAVEYETLKITQMNNPDGCKFGLWANSELERGSELSKSEEFKKVMALHYEFHDHAVSCFLLKESYKNKESLAEFQMALATYELFAAAMEELHKYLNSCGIMDETEVWVFEG